ncbi:hypothetical protein [Novosphingobium taihuense]|uniref:DUF1214 domain-containing protein n=1 Tax=Novosphingobium taihuense TaxID=260085 RepID=A0A7W7AEZ4_9SPHN|nr:hypothetical protein [Novosphingobium taihuense]MBB4615030.1 hypothetical protein [Novosphingobium taihuense]TWH84528.1 hypothetical protein IQ25_02283 [Novosphingobium taihuense]
MSKQIDLLDGSPDGAEQDLLHFLRRDLLKCLGVGAAMATWPAAAASANSVTTPVLALPGIKAWNDYLDALKPAGAVAQMPWFRQDDLTRAKVYQQLVMNIAQGYFWYFQATPEHPDWMPFENSVFLLQPNPDGIYHIAPVDGRGVYRIVGNRGGNKVMGFATGAGMLGTRAHADAMARGKPAFNNYDADGLVLGENGAFEVIFSARRPDGWTGDWRFLDPMAETILIRQFSYDWGNEPEARFAIERLDVAPLKPALTAVQISERLDLLLGDFVGRFSKFVAGFQQQLGGKLGFNVMELSGFEDMGNSPEWPQKYWRCVYDFKPGEALIIETDIPKAKYWNVQINDLLWNQVEFAHRQSSLNGHQARMDSDGKFRAVIAMEDPGIPNWLDTGGSTRGMLVGRWHRAESYPMPTIRKVPLQDVSKFLPKDTPKFSRAEREKVLRTRNIGVQLRRRW